MCTAESLIIDHLAIWSSAIKAKSSAGRGGAKKQECYGIKKLRELILELAVRGLLVPQDPDDEPASECLKKIAIDRAALIKSGKLKKMKHLPVETTECPHDIPSTWQWVRFGEIAIHNAGKTLDQGRNSGELRDYITTSNLYWGRFDLTDVRKMAILEEELDKCTATWGDLLLCEGGEAGRAAVWTEQRDICFQNHIHRARLLGGIDPFFAYRFFEKLSLSGEIDDYRKGVGISNMSGKALASISFPLPPLAEQHRIVAKIDELIALCDQLEQQQVDCVRMHGTLVQTLLNTLTSASEHRQFAEAWQRIASHFDTLFTTESSIVELKQTILQLAVMGKLVEQDPNDESASQLLLKGARDKTKTLQEGGQKEGKPLPPINLAAIPHALAKGWSWVRLGEISIIERGGSPRPIKSFLTDLADGLNWIKIGDTDQGGKYIRSTEEKIRPDGLKKSRMVYPGDFLLTNSMSFGRPYITLIEGCIHDGWLRISPPESLVKDYLYHYLSSPFVRRFFKAAAAGAVVQNLNSDKVRLLPIALPPLAEQRRIVAKVEELMDLCERLNASLQTAQATQVNLADSLVEAAIQSHP